MQGVPADVFAIDRTPWGSLEKKGNAAGIVAFGHEIMVNDCLIPGQRALPTYRKSPQVFDFARNAAYNAALSTHFVPDEA
jgi:hypothetical protein